VYERVVSICVVPCHSKKPSKERNIFRDSRGGSATVSRFFIPTDRAEPARSGTGLPVRFGREPVGNRTNSNSNSNHAVQTGPTGIPAGLTGIPGRYSGKPSQQRKKPMQEKWFSGVK
jgi:hypothetical protein